MRNTYEGDRSPVIKNKLFIIHVLCLSDRWLLPKVQNFLQDSEVHFVLEKEPNVP